MVEPAKKKARTSKLQMLSSLCTRLPHMSQSSLSAVLTELQTHPLPSCKRRQDIRAARNEKVFTTTPYGRIHQDVKMGGCHIEVQHPWAMFYQLCQTSASFSNLVKQVHMQIPCTADSPWNLIIYSDEVSPGNQLLPVNTRKLQCVYWSIDEFGDSMLCDEEVA